MKKSGFIISIFTIMSFVLAMTAFVFNGILDQVAVSLDITVAESGLLNTMYAYGAALGAPITLIVFRRIERSKMLKLTLAVTMIMTILLIVTQSFYQMLLVRLIMGISANSYGVLAISTVVALAPKGKHGRVMASLITGSSMALVIGIPLTRILSSVLDWRNIFMILTGFMIFSLIIFLIYLPEGDHESTKINILKELSLLKDGRVSLIIVYTLMMFVGYGAFYTYLTPYLLTLFPTVQALMGGILLFVGIASFIGNFIGGHVSDFIGYRKSMFIGAVCQTIFLVVHLLTRQFVWISILMAILWMASCWFTGLQLNTGIAQATDNKSSLLISFNTSSIQLGGAIGSSFSAYVIAQTDIRNIAAIALSAGIGIIVVQFMSLRKFVDLPIGIVEE